jgi:hypothetical protein
MRHGVIIVVIIVTRTSGGGIMKVAQGRPTTGDVEVE